MTSIISLLYDEYKPETYQGVKVDIPYTREEKIFNSGNPSVDYEEALIFAESKSDIVMKSSSVDHFVMDGGKLVAK